MTLRAKGARKRRGKSGVNMNALRPRSPAAGPRPHDVSTQTRTLEPRWSPVGTACLTFVRDAYGSPPRETRGRRVDPRRARARRLPQVPSVRDAPMR